MKDTPVTPCPATEAGAEPHQHGYISDKDRYLQRMKRIEDQARGIAKLQEASDAIKRLVRS